jgi:DNA-binding NarL/FixJ family response regulator
MERPTDLATAATRRPPVGSRTVRAAIRVLLVEDDPSDAVLTREALLSPREPRFDLVHRLHLRGALESLAGGVPDVVLSDLSLPDAQGIETCERFLEAYPNVPLVVLTGTEDEDLGLRAVQRGAQDYLVKGRIAPDVLARSLHYAIERHALRAKVEEAARETRASEVRLRTLIARSSEGMLVVDAARRVLFANPAAEALFGRSAAALLGSPFEVPIVGGEPREVTIERPDGSTIPAEMRATVLEWEGGPATLTSLYDLSDRKRVERIALAQNVQRAFLPERIEGRAGVIEMGGVNELCEDASGDYYDFIDLGDGRSLVATGDVTGHGLGPALLMAQARAFLRSFCRSAPDLGSLMSRLNDALVADMSHGRFMTFFLAEVDVRTGAVSWCNAGHVPAFLLRAGTGEIRRLDATGLVLGVLAGVAFELGDGVVLAPGDTLLLCSDGATEAANPSGEQFGEPRLEAVLRAEAQGGVGPLLETLQAAVRTWRSGRALGDDMTLVAVRRL